MPKESSRKTDKAKSGTKPRAAKRRNGKQSDENGSSRRTLVVDVGGSGIKATLLNDLGKAVSERLRRDSPASGPPLHHRLRGDAPRSANSALHNPVSAESEDVSGSSALRFICFAPDIGMLAARPM